MSSARSSRPSRRGFLLGAGLVVVGGAGGLVAGLAADRSSSEPTEPPRPELLLAAVAAERKLIADLDATQGGTDLLRRIRADHAAHLSALLAAATLAAGGAPEPTPSGSSGPVLPRGDELDGPGLIAKEAAASRAAATRAASATGHDAVLLASIAACEATHAELLR